MKTKGRLIATCPTIEDAQKALVQYFMGTPFELRVLVPRYEWEAYRVSDGKQFPITAYFHPRSKRFQLRHDA